MAAIGTVLDNKYEILTELGRGGMSVVYLAMDRRLNKQWAIKEVRKQTGNKNSEVVVQSLLAEAEMLKKLDHPLIPRIVDIIEDDETIFVVMDYMTGKSLDKVLLEQGPLPQEDVIHIGIQLCDALTYLHTREKPIIYRDMKPANVMLKDPETMSIELFDFGIAREYKEGKTGDTTLLGTRGFAAPEQIRRGKQTDARTDIYSLGVTLYNLVTGHSPVTDNKLYGIRHWDPRLSGGLEQIIMKCTQEEPEDRYQTCEELKAALENYELFDDDFRRSQRRTLSLFLVPAILAVLCLIGGFLFRGLYAHENTANLDSVLAMAEREPDPELRQGYYLQAVGYDAADVRAYEGLVSLFKQDASFTTDERAVLHQQLQQNLDAVRERSMEDYVQLCYDVGSLYWFYYDYGDTADNQSTRMTNALPWFTLVQQTCQQEQYDFSRLTTTDIFIDIGTFYRDYANHVREAQEEGIYSAFWTSLEQMRQYMGANDEQELVEWESYKLIVYALENLIPKFEGDGVSLEQVQSMIQAVRDDTAALDATTDVTAGLRDYINQTLAEGGAVQRSITASYGS